MKKVTGLIAILVAVLLVPVAVSAQVMGGDRDNVNVGAAETIDDDLYVAGRNVVIEGTVNGDVYAVGSSVTIRGTVNGDVIAAGQDLLIGGSVKGSVRVAGQTVRIDNAKIGNSVSAAAQNLTVESNTTIGGGFNYGASTAVIRGSVARSLMGAASAMTLGGAVGKEAQLTGDTITLASTAVINGNLTHYGDSQLQRDQGSQVKGEVKQVASQPHKKHDGGSSVWGILWGLVSLYLAGALVLWLAPTTIRGAAKAAAGRLWPSLGVGLAALLLIIPVTVILLVTVVGIPIAILLMVLYLVALYLGKFVVALAIGGLIARRTDWTPNPYADAAIGLILLTIIGLIPVVGGLVGFAILLLGSGALLLTRFQMIRTTPAK
jgi:cytoskeletal protein CcmA (bactofilin family)